MIIFLSVILTISITSNIILYYLLNRSANISLLLEDKVNTLEQWVSDFQQSILTTYKNLKKVDDSGIFEKDDSVGFVFQDMLHILEVCNNRINEYNNPETDKNIVIEKENNEQTSNTNADNNAATKPIDSTVIEKNTSYFNNEDRAAIADYINRKQRQTNL